MGNYLGVPAVQWDVMAANQQSFGIDHVTVVPDNFQTGESDDETRRTPDSS
ncbi:MAG: hypothetical protein ABEH84_01720 [Halobacterium sp.]